MLIGFIVYNNKFKVWPIYSFVLAVWSKKINKNVKNFQTKELSLVQALESNDFWR